MRAVLLCQEAGFAKVSLRGDSDFALTAHFDLWHDMGSVRFVFGLDAMPNLVARAKALPEEAWQELRRPPPYEVKTRPRRRPQDVKAQVVQRQGYEDLRLEREEVAQFSYRPGRCKRDYRVVVLRKHIGVYVRGQKVRDEVRHLFYVTNEWDWSCAEVVHFANGRCNQENLIEQLKNGLAAWHAPVNTLLANGAYMAIGCLAFCLKVWLALLHPDKEARATLLSWEFKAFLKALVLLPCQVLRTGRRLVWRLLGWSAYASWLLQAVEALRLLRLG
jgi:hypothetical protein